MTIAARRALTAYRRKRDFDHTAEPAGAAALSSTGQRYVMHKHAATHDHYDLRLEEEGVLRSWALPKGPSLKRGEKRLAVEVEDHPIEYGAFEGTIPKGQYGGGTVMLWDTGSWVVDLMEVLKERLRGKLRARAAPASSAGKRSGARVDELESKTKAELYEMAQSMGVPGRSAMSKAKLIDALAR